MTDALRDILDGGLLTPGDPRYDPARRAALPWYDARPLAVVDCASVRDVVAAVRWARDAGTHLVPRGGGHCFAGRSSTDGLQVDLRALDAIRVTGDGRAVIGAGARLAAVYDALHAAGRAVSAGCGPTVGIAGLALGGGLGLLGRAHGLTCDALVGAQIVLADGRVVACAADREPDLFWALRGAGGAQFGVVASLEFATVPEPRATRVELSWPEAAAAAVVAGWQDWAPDAPDDVTVNLSVVAEPGRPLRVTAFGAVLRPGDPARAVLDGLVAATGVRPDVRLRAGLYWRDLKRSFQDAAAPLRSRSEFVARSLPDAAIAALLDALTTGLRARRELNLTAMGGAYDRPAPDATAFAHRGQRFLLDHAAVDDEAWLDRSWTLAHAHASGAVYPNFPDPRLDDAPTAYHGANLARLVDVKRVYDPDSFFRFPQCIGPDAARSQMGRTSSATG